jgi:CheY-like chemotaxis protein
MGKYIDVLAIDDEQIILDAIRKICEDHNLTVDAVLDVALAEKKLIENDYGLILCDLMMPNKDGFQVLKQAKEEKSKTPVILMTGFSTTENAVKSLFYGAIDFIPKPFTEDELIASVYRGIRFIKVIHNKRQAFLPEDFFCLGIGSWVLKQEDGTVTIGITRTYLDTIEDFVSIELIHSGHQLVQGVACAKLISSGLTHNYIAPISGSILDYNKVLEDHSDLLRADTYGEGWIYRVLPADLEREGKYLIPCKDVLS